MTTYDNAEPMADWRCEPRPNPLEPVVAVKIPANIVLGAE